MLLTEKKSESPPEPRAVRIDHARVCGNNP